MAKRLHNLEPLDKRLYDRIKKKESGCWEWTGGLTRYGYGVFYPYGRKSKRIYPHRYFYEKNYGIITDGKYVCHKCDNPKCVNPNHLFLGTQKDNCVDMSLKNRARNQFGSQLSQETCKKIRDMYETGNYKQIQLAEMFGVSQTTISNRLSHRLYELQETVA